MSFFTSSPDGTGLVGFLLTAESSALSCQIINICVDFWLSGAKIFITIYNMSDFAAVIFSRYYALIFLFLMGKKSIDLLVRKFDTLL